MERTNEETKWYFEDPRLSMTIGGRILVRSVGYVTYALLVVAGGVFLLSDLRAVQSLGILIVLFLADRAMHLGQSDETLFRVSSGKVNAAEYLMPSAYHLLEPVYDRARLSAKDWRLLLFGRLLRYPEIREVFLRVDVTPQEFEAKFEDYLQAAELRRVSKPDLLIEIGHMVVQALFEARRGEVGMITPLDFFAVLSASEEPVIARLRTLFHLERNDLREAAFFTRLREERGMVTRLRRFFDFAERRKVSHIVMNRAWTARPTPLLDRFGEDMTDFARVQGGFLIGHEAEYHRMVDVLSRAGNPNVVLVGDPGSGKTSLLRFLAYNIVRDRVPSPLFDRRLVSLDVSALVSGASREEISRRMHTALEEITVSGNVILAIPDIHNLFKTSDRDVLQAVDILLPAIKSPSVSVIGMTSPREFKRYVEPRSDVLGTFEAVHVRELTEEEAVHFLAVRCLVYESEYGVTASLRAMKEAVHLSHRYFREKLLPGSAEDLLRETFVEVKERGAEMVTVEDVIRVAEKRTNVPLHRAGKREAEEFLHLEDRIHGKLVDQDEAVAAVAQALREYRSGMKLERGPIGAFLFVGPTGVGKTELANILAEILFGARTQMIRLDMAEYQTRESIARLIGSPDGTVRGALTDAVLERPYSVVLLDEFEKAHPDILNIFLSIFDEGRLTDALERTIDFTNTLIIATSNAHAELFTEALGRGEGVASIAEYVKARLAEVFRPELLNRFSKIAIFKNLGPRELERVVVLHLNAVAATLREQGVTFSASPAVVREIARRGFDPVFGARPIRRVVEEAVRGPIAERILKGEVQRGDALAIDVRGESVIIDVMPRS